MPGITNAGYVPPHRVGYTGSNIKSGTFATGNANKSDSTARDVLTAGATIIGLIALRKPIGKMLSPITNAVKKKAPNLTQTVSEFLGTMKEKSRDLLDKSGGLLEKSKDFLDTVKNNSKKLVKTKFSNLTEKIPKPQKNGVKKDTPKLTNTVKCAYERVKEYATKAWEKIKNIFSNSESKSDEISGEAKKKVTEAAASGKAGKTTTDSATEFKNDMENFFTNPTKESYRGMVKKWYPDSPNGDNDKFVDFVNTAKEKGLVNEKGRWIK